MDLRTFHPGGAVLGRPRSRPGDAAVATTAQTVPGDMAVALTGSSMRVMEAGLAIIALVTALLLGLGR